MGLETLSARLDVVLPRSRVSQRGHRKTDLSLLKVPREKSFDRGMPTRNKNKSQPTMAENGWNSQNLSTFDNIFLDYSALSLSLLSKNRLQILEHQFLSGQLLS